MKNEAFSALNKFFSKDGTKVNYHGEGKGVLLFKELYESGEYFVGDEPDMFIKKGDIALIIEHFEFDSYKSTKRGSKSRQEQARIERCGNNIKPTEDGVLLHETINAVSSYENYINSVTKGFLKHYDNISDYKKRLKNFGLLDNDIDLKILFLIEDTSPLGSSYLDEEDFPPVMRPLVLAECREFLDLLKEHEAVDYVLACSGAGDNNYVWFIDQKDIDEYYKYVHMDDKFRFLDFVPHVLEYKMLVPEKI